MQYTRYTFSVSGLSESLSPDIVFDLLSEDLAELGFECFELKNEQLLAYVPSSTTELSFDELFEHFPIPNLLFSFESELMPDENWNKEWENNYFQPLLLAGGRCLIKAPFHESVPSCQIEIIIEPKMAFGTGNHETTSLIISYLLEHDIKGLNVLDMGCGTGILGILALKEGAESLISIDIDEWAYENVKENAVLNHVTIKEIIHGDASKLRGNESFDLILANITRNILLEDMPKYVASLKNGGKLVLSGFYEEDKEILCQRGQELGLSYKSHSTANKWCMLELIKDF